MDAGGLIEGTILVKPFGVVVIFYTRARAYSNS